MDEKLKNIQKNSPSVRGKHFNILKNQFLVLFGVGALNISVIISENFIENGFLGQHKQYIFPVTIPFIAAMMVFILRKLFFLKKRTEVLVSYVDKIINDENKFRALFEGAIDGHALIHPERGVLEYNKAFKKIFKLSDVSSFLLESYVKVNYRIDLNSCETFAEFKKKAIGDGVAMGYWKVETFEGEIIPTYITLNKLVIDNENLFMVSIHDETRTEQRQTQLKKITAKAVEATKAKSEFLANMTHELRTPLNGIIGVSEDLLLSEETKGIHNDIKIINGSGKSLLNLINDVLDYSKLDAEKVTLENNPVAMDDLLKSLECTFQNMALKKKISFIIDIDNTLPDFFIGDKVRLQQVLINLIGNAIKFTSVGSVRLKIKLEKEKENDGVILGFYVFDTGIGIPQEALGNLFNSFEQVDSSTTRKFGGSGLGLSISKQLVALMHSSIVVESELNKGSCFSFKLETKKHTQLEAKKDGKAHEVIELQNFTLQKKILIAEDNKINQVVAKKYFKRMGFIDISFAENGQEALDMTLKHKYDYIFMDMQMPVMDGITATERIYDEIHFLDAPVIIAMTANNSEEDKKLCKNAGMVAFLTKPLDIEDIKETIIKFEVGYEKAA